MQFTVYNRAMNFFFSFFSISQGHKVGILDGDIYGPSIPTLMNLHGEPELNKRELGETFCFSFEIKKKKLVQKMF